MNKICTSLEQSQKLIELGIDVNTADLTILDLPIQGGDRFKYISIKLPNDTFPSITDGKSEKVPAWSLAALLNVLPNEISLGEEWHSKYQINIRKYNGVDNTTWYQIAYGNNRGSSGSWHDMINTGERQNLIDCCFDMILLCKEHKWL